MKTVLVLSDAHANRAALTNVLGHESVLKADAVIFAGDEVNYCAHPAEVLAMLRSDPRIIAWVSSDHAKVVSGTHSDADSGYKFGGTALALVDFTREQIGEEGMTFLKTLPEMKILTDRDLGMPERTLFKDMEVAVLKGKGQKILDFALKVGNMPLVFAIVMFWPRKKAVVKKEMEAPPQPKVLVVHASPRNPCYEYLDTEESLVGGSSKLPSNYEVARKLGVSLVIFGHTHIPRLWVVRSGVVEKVILNPGQKFVIPQEEGVVTFANPGSVGQPRTGNPRSDYAFLTVGNDGSLTWVSNRRKCDFKEEQAAILKVAESMPDDDGRKADLVRNAERLSKGE